MKLETCNPFSSAQITLSLEEVAMLYLCMSWALARDEVLDAVIPECCAEDDADRMIDFLCELDRQLLNLLA